MTDLRPAVGNILLAAILCVQSVAPSSCEYDFQGESTATAANGLTSKVVIVG